MRAMNIFKQESGNRIKLHKPIVTRFSTTYDCVYFGSYPQTDVSGRKKEPIKWRVLFIEENYALLIADQILDVMRYNETCENVIWENCTLRSWLNGYSGKYNICNFDYTRNNFLEQAFTQEEQEAIQIVDGGISTIVTNYNKDKVFLLSFFDATKVSYGFSLNSDYDSCRVREATKYAAFMEKLCKGDTTFWWLCSTGMDMCHAMGIIKGGQVSEIGAYTHTVSQAICPALWLDLRSDCWWKADTITIDKDNSSNMSYNEDNQNTSSAKYIKVGNKEPLIIEEEDYTEQEFAAYKKLFGCPDNVTRIKVISTQIEYM